MQLFLEQVLNGIAMGSIYALVTLGLALVYGILRILHVAHAAVYTVGAYIGLLIFKLTGNVINRGTVPSYSRPIYSDVSCNTSLP
jgi:branched-chain amino acid transport system permease protein